MRLTELKPKWIGDTVGNDRQTLVINGITFLCPHCGKQTGQRLGIMFTPVIQIGGKSGNRTLYSHGAIEWTRTGEDFESITFSPSINTENQRIEILNHWHGHIIKGEVI